MEMENKPRDKDQKSNQHLFQRFSGRFYLTLSRANATNFTNVYIYCTLNRTGRGVSSQMKLGLISKKSTRKACNRRVSTKPVLLLKLET